MGKAKDRKGFYQKEEIIKIIKDEVAKEFGAERIKEFKYFGPYEGEDLDVPLAIQRAKEGMEEGV